jgi:hypothetical protein
MQWKQTWIDGPGLPFWQSFECHIYQNIDDNGCKLKTRDLIFFTKSSAISPKALNLFAFIDCNKGMSSLIRVVLEISKNGQCLYYRNVLFQLMYKICLTGFAHCAIVVKQLCWNRTNWVQKWSHHLLMVLCLWASIVHVVSTILVHGPSWSHSKIWLTKLSWSVVLGTLSLFIWILS